jgi:hypothetical protein
MYKERGQRSKKKEEARVGISKKTKHDDKNSSVKIVLE